MDTTPPSISQSPSTGTTSLSSEQRDTPMTPMSPGTAHLVDQIFGEDLMSFPFTFESPKQDQNFNGGPIPISVFGSAPMWWQDSNRSSNDSESQVQAQTNYSMPKLDGRWRSPSPLSLDWLANTAKSNYGQHAFPPPHNKYVDMGYGGHSGQHAPSSHARF